MNCNLSASASFGRSGFFPLNLDPLGDELAVRSFEMITHGALLRFKAQA
jgi:hypothetical protein